MGTELLLRQNMLPLGFGYDGVDCSNAPSPTLEPTEEQSCSDDPANWMKKQGKECDDESIRSDLLSKYCNKHNQWKNKQFCSLSCARLGVGYEGLDCGDIPTLEPVEEPQQECSDDPAGWMKKQEKACTDVDESQMRSQYCINSSQWVKKEFCAATCARLGVGYEGLVCGGGEAPVPEPTPEPVQCTDKPAGWMDKQGKICTDADEEQMRTQYCTNNSQWVKKEFCAATCARLGVGYEGLDCGDDGGEAPAPAPTVEPIPAPTPGGGGTGNCNDDSRPNFMTKNDRTCNSYTPSQYQDSNWCNKSSNWTNRQFCAQTCFDMGMGYEGLDC